MKYLLSVCVVRVNVARDRYLVAKLTNLESKVDAILHLVTRLSGDNMPAIPELPDDIRLPLENLEDLNTVDRAITNSSDIKQAMVKHHFYEHNNQYKLMYPEILV